MSQPKLLKPEEHNPLNVLGTKVSFLAEATETNSKWSCMLVDLPFEAGPPPHHHEWDEANYVIEGKVKFIIGEKEKIVEKGDFIYAPGGTIHGFFGADENSVAKVIVFDAPSTVGGFFKECDAEVKNMPEDAQKIPGLADKYGMTFLPPK